MVAERLCSKRLFSARNRSTSRILAVSKVISSVLARRLRIGELSPLRMFVALGNRSNSQAFRSFAFFAFWKMAMKSFHASVWRANEADIVA